MLRAVGAVRTSSLSFVNRQPHLLSLIPRATPAVLVRLASLSPASTPAGPTSRAPTSPVSTNPPSFVPVDRPVPKPVSAESWFGLRDGLRVALASMGLKHPSEVQAMAIPAILDSKDVLISAATGTGKTLAYLLPVVHALKAAEDAGVVSRPGRPRAVVMVPTRELALQVTAVAKALCHTTKFSCTALVGGRKESQQREQLSRPVDVVVATPGRLVQALTRKWLYLTDCRHVIIDEADTMLHSDSGFTEEVRAVLVPLQRVLAEQERTEAALADGQSSSSSSASGAAAAPPATPARVIASQGLQFVLVAATMPQHVLKQVTALFPTVTPVSARSTHRLPTTLKQMFMRVGGEADAKHQALFEALRHAGITKSPAGTDDKGGPLYDVSQRVLVFCNTIDSARSTAHVLGEAGYTVASLHGAIPPQLRQSEYNLFTSGRCNVLVCTDAAGRGLDFPGLHHVLCFDFPLSPVDYLHRAGRAGRAGKAGTVISLVAKRDAVLATAIERAAAAGEEVASLSSDALAYVPHAQRGVYKAARAYREERGAAVQAGRRPPPRPDILRPNRPPRSSIL